MYEQHPPIRCLLYILKTIFIVTNVSPFTLSIETSFSVPVPCVNGGFEDAASTFVKMSEWYSVSKLQFALPQFIFFVWSYPTCCVSSLRAVPVGCISYKPVYCVTFGHSVEGTNQIYDDDDDDDDDDVWMADSKMPRPLLLKCQL